MHERPMPALEVDELDKHQGDGWFVRDVREPDEYAEVHVPGAVLIPLGELPARQDEIPEGRPLLVICATGARSARAVEALRAAGYDASNVVGGARAWVDAGFPLDEGAD